MLHGQRGSNTQFEAHSYANYASSVHQRRWSIGVFGHLRLLMGVFFLLLGLTPLIGQTTALEYGAEGAIVLHGVDTSSLERHEWINEAVAILKAKGTGDCSMRLERRTIEEEDSFMISYTLRSREGCIVFPNGEWLYLLMHSSHSNEAVGDMTLAIDTAGRLYMNEGHVCGGRIAFYTGEKVPMDSVADFIRYSLSDTDDKAWTRFE